MFAGQDADYFAAWSLVVPYDDADIISDSSQAKRRYPGRKGPLECDYMQFDEACYTELREETLEQKFCDKDHEMLHVPPHDAAERLRVGEGNVLVGEEINPAGEWLQRLKEKRKFIGDFKHTLMILACVLLISIHDRDSHGYLPPCHLKPHALQHIGPTTPSKEFVARSSADPVLTAFAQLGTLRLNAHRSLISLFGRNEQHVLTEATRTLSLQDDGNHNARDELWVGSCTMSYDRSLCKLVMNSTPSTSNTRDRVLVVPDLAEDHAFKNHPDVTTFPNIRFLASSPIISPKGIVIGAYTILDDQPREPLDAGSLQFLVDIAATVMDYLSTSHSKARRFRSERMMVGLGSFLEGKGSLRNSWVLDTDVPQTIFDEMGHAEGHINREQQEKQLSHNITQAIAQNGKPSHLPFRPYNLHIPGGKTLQGNREKYQSLSDSTTSKRDAKALSKLKEVSQAAMVIGNDQSRQQSPKDDYTAKVNESFGRAANLIREGIEVEAVVFFDANFGSQETLVDNAESDTEGSSFESCSSGDEATFRSSPQRSSFDPEQAKSSGKATLNPCEILGFATSNASSVNGQLMDDSKIALSESFLGGLLHRYPRGKVFNFGDDGTISSDDTSDGIIKRFLRRPGGKNYKKTRKSLARQDAQGLLQLAPESRSIIFSPLWDSHKGRWYSGALAWTKAPHRVFTSNDELAYLLTFGTSVMAEVHRLGAHFADRAKSDLLSGLSHELRSPLHGIFGTAELLNDTVMDTLQREFIHTISSCAYTLLGSINQLLEHASINDVRPNSVAKPPGGSIDGIRVDRKVAAARRSSNSGKKDVDTCVELDATLEDAVETVFAGYSFFSSSRTPLRGIAGPSALDSKHALTRGGVKVVLDIDHALSWKFLTQAGAWHVILTNIFGNALKFTQRGYIHISMKASPTKFGPSGEAIASAVTVTVKDTGSGIDPDFLKNGLFTAFSQEDSMTTGNGLGLSITRRIILSLGGDLQVNSEKNVGTEVVATVTLNHASALDNLEKFNSPSPITMTQKLACTKTIGILGVGTPELDTALYTSLRKMCLNWFSMEVVLYGSSQAQFAHCDLYISSYEYLDIGNQEIRAIAPSPGSHFSSPLIVICPSARTAHSLSVEARNRGDAHVREFISQPCGPRKLAKALETCIHRQQLRLESLEVEKNIPDGSAGFPADLSTAESEMDSFVSPPSNGEVNEQTIKVVADSESCSQPSIGTLESVRLPRGNISNPLSPFEEAATTSHNALIKNQNDPVSNLPTTILLVDDNDINLRILIAFMKKLNCDYVIAQNGEEALEAFKASSSDIGMILMDISMPIMDGLESSRRIREFEKKLETKSRVKIAALTGVAQADTQRNAIGSGMDLFLTKPIRLNSLVPIIKGIMPPTHALWQE
ncbi:CheY-like superfamily [Penicillium italicum]|uniref:CheY-like superfamily n=1 Tax=Penicillium italicum TaxID=40296 RepID=A0A0A2KS49_PENIT|nr:CheY-like superfamily [Penicillium italicum]